MENRNRRMALRGTGGLVALAGLAGLGLVAVRAAPPAAPQAAMMKAPGSGATPTVVELFQSQGCSSCPPAAAVVNRLADRPDILALSFEVTYWDQLGWKDSFAKPAFTQRQWDYAHASGRPNVYTPQVVINGRTALVGNVRREVEQAIERTVRATGPAIRHDASKVSVGAGRGKATVWLVRYDPRTFAVPIGAGENAGRTLPHRNVVRELVKLGDWRGAAQDYRLPTQTRGLDNAILVQQSNGGPILAAARI